MLISLVINVDTRPQKGTADAMFSGTSNLDYLTDGVFNKIQFFKGFDIETIVFIDEHLPVPERELQYLRDITDCIVIRKHTNEHAFNDWNYHKALSLASGDIVCHMDQDTACFANNPEYIKELISHLDNHKFVSYPSHWTPRAITDESFGKRTWASTRFFICKRETLKLEELANCIRNPEWGYEKYGDSPRRCNWTEHYLTLINEDSCYYPPIEADKGLIFSWATYEQYTLRRLNLLPYEDVVKWVIGQGGIHYPVEVNC
jgi:hypothetical protein